MAKQPDAGQAGGAAGKVRVGTASWTDPTLLKSGWYPKGASDAKTRLRFYTTQFPIVEVDATYYYLPREEQAGLWVDRTPPDFVFNIKAFSLLTGHPTRRKALPEDLLGEVAPEHLAKERFYASHLSADGQAEVWRRFRDALLPLDSAGKLGAVLMQYPEWFTPRRSSREELQAIRDRLAGYQACVEFRNAAWLATDRDRERTLGLLRDLDLPLVCVDMPQGFRSSVPPIAEATSPALSVVRFHGRDPDAWTKKTVTERFHYLYTEAEMAEWVPKVDHLAESAREVHVLMNNCFSDHAVINARQLTDLLDSAVLPVVTSD
ncbi:MAG TPA: DUF72 domain-containing protein, partial [Actinomycetes bacterium]|nr:DUF72 domain-containing protein [Actinomycetes bacterium]